MSGWQTISFKTDIDAKHSLINQLEERQTGYVADGTNAHAYVKVPYRLGVNISELLDETSDLWEKCVVIRANDTGDTGAGVLYEQRDGDVTETDRFKEEQYRHGSYTGRMAAAYMLIEHHVEAVHDFGRQPFFDIHDATGED